MRTACRCSTCTNPVGDLAVKVIHKMRHRVFAGILAERPDPRGFNPPTPRRIVEMAAGEWDAPQAEDVWTPSQPGGMR